MVRNHREKRVKFLYILDSIEAWKVSEQYLVYYIVTNKLPRVFFNFIIENNFGISSIVYLVDKQAVEFVDINGIEVFYFLSSAL